MALGLAESLIACGGLDVEHVARTWAENRQWTRGYGPGAWKVLGMIAEGADPRTAGTLVFPDGSFGNGGAMRAAPLALFFHGCRADLKEAAVKATSITHSHPLGIQGGLLIALSVDRALEAPGARDADMMDSLKGDLDSPEFTRRLEAARDLLTVDAPPAAVRRILGNSVLAHESAVTALYLSLRFKGDFAGMMDFIIRLGGDTDTIGAMAGGIFGALNGFDALPSVALEALEARDRIEEAGRSIYRSPSRPGRCEKL
jgi:ADP-ribosylglycohydrolase